MGTIEPSTPPGAPGDLRIHLTKNTNIPSPSAARSCNSVAVVIKSDTLNELRRNATYSRQYAAALIAHAERIEALIDAEAMVADIGASGAPAEPGRAEAPVEPASAEPARTEAPTENLHVEEPSEAPRIDPSPAEPPHVEAPIEIPRVDVPPVIFSRPEMPRPNREIGVTQADAIKTALQRIGHPASLGEIFNTIKSQRIPVKLTSAENLRLVMSRSDDFESNASGQWQLKTANSASEFTDQANGAGAPESGQGSPEMAELVADARG